MPVCMWQVYGYEAMLHQLTVNTSEIGLLKTHCDGARGISSSFIIGPVKEEDTKLEKKKKFQEDACPIKQLEELLGSLLKSCGRILQDI
ncbi:unnamed protein product [Nezara viridula]|uniref:Uncharacterized protein n=1 Tax=Nezara viridula TaxID=85310 RepID=A0A9P0GUH9_NEZVI|nr:unnamed protein product [Nezara viridula]